MGFLPTTREEMEQRGISQLDFVYVIGDAYVDHSSFGPAVISRVLESHGYSVGLIAQPDWKRTRAFLFWENQGWRSWSPPEIWIPW